MDENGNVYINFNHKDSSVSSFISYLFDAFSRNGISAFFDGENSHVEPADREKAEEKFSTLKVFVVVFSLNFVSHLPCLEKHIYSCRKNDDFVVVPVFYRVSISSVKQHMENSGDEFEAVQRSMHKLRRCHEYDGKRSEREFLEEIVRDVFEKLYPTEEIGIQSSLRTIKDLLCKQPWGVRTIGIFGDPGIGKTTLARSVSVKCLLAMTILASSDSEPRYRKKRVLVALDDVEKAQDAKSFLGGFDKFGPGSLIIITSKYKKVLQECSMNEIYKLKGLNYEDSMKLFRRCAFGKDVIEENLVDHSSVQAIECCDGNPSALRSYAQEFKSKTTKSMESALPDDYEMFITGNPVKNTYIRTAPYEEDDELETNKEFLSDQNSILSQYLRHSLFHPFTVSAAPPCRLYFASPLPLFSQLSVYVSFYCASGEIQRADVIVVPSPIDGAVSLVDSREIIAPTSDVPCLVTGVFPSNSDMNHDYLNLMSSFGFSFLIHEGWFSSSLYVTIYMLSDCREGYLDAFKLRLESAVIFD
ncbi:hypothetical protein HID58_033421 [Brassica napus]|uniref:TIR domain-containing protein n=1 Tax=Brassica napus TaxID=3708 RepID=A0ABQ8BZ63_BRANA|nr:hypothetical protein HID58_033421 [Brassica napus]